MEVENLNTKVKGLIVNKMVKEPDGWRYVLNGKGC